MPYGHINGVVISSSDGQVELSLEGELVIWRVDDYDPRSRTQLGVRESACICQPQRKRSLLELFSTYHDEACSSLSGWELMGEHS